MTCPNHVEQLETRIALSTLNLEISDFVPKSSTAPAPLVEGIAAALTPEISADGKTATFVDTDGDVFKVATTKGQFTAANFTYLGDTETGRGYLQKIDVSYTSFGFMFYGSKITVTVDQVVGDGFADVGYLDAFSIDLKQVVVAGDLVAIDAGDGNLRTPAIGLLQADQMGFHTAADAGLESFVSGVYGRINVLDVGSWADASLYVHTGEKNPKFGSIGRATIQTMTGGSVEFAGSLVTTGSIGTLIVQGELTGGSANSTGWISAGLKIGSVTVGGNIVGGAGNFAGSISTGEEKGSIGSVFIGGNIEGSSGEWSGSVFSAFGTKSFTVQGDVVAGSNVFSGSIVLYGSTKTITVGGELIGGTSTSGIFVEKKLGKLMLGGADGTSGPAYVIVGGPLLGGVAIERIAVTESLNGAKILAGYGPDLKAYNPNVKIGKITIGGDLIATDIAVGIDHVNGVFGDADDQALTAGAKPGFLSSIASIVVGGIAQGTEGGTDQFGILAERIGFVQIGGQVQPTANKTIEDFPIGTTGDYRLREVVSFV